MKPLSEFFCAVHKADLLAYYKDYGDDFAIVPREPLKLLGLEEPLPEETVTIIHVCVKKNGGQLTFYTVQECDAIAVQAWEEKHKTTPVDSFHWCPFNGVIPH